MIKLTPQEMSRLRSFIGSPEWKMMQSIASLLIQNINQTKNIKNTSQWKYLETSLTTRGKIIGINEFFKEIKKLSEL